METLNQLLFKILIIVEFYLKHVRLQCLLYHKTAFHVIEDEVFNNIKIYHPKKQKQNPSIITQRITLFFKRNSCKYKFE